ncbi:HK97 family phage prohead protease [Bacillus nitratireducens]|uniref:HK97 family phage prohead protease n=1 Tax=Bacillus nitratireducens TaxID=2026193 RepID=UPI002840EB42|nr:HK97 family phage prohead protease [Bacillus nitratireducens]MDR4170369.1 HK97 family phage prohead protease [Bacillus nitratireducens]
MTINKMELRFNEFELNKNEQGQLKVSGYVNKTNQWSQTLGKQKKFVERILPGAFRKAIQTGNEIHFLAEHDNAKILSSTRNGSLSLREDENGLFMEATISDTSWGRDYHTLITDGIIKNMSFGMQVLKDSWKKLADGTYERSISDIYLAEVSAVRNPAYVQSTIQADRSIEVIEDVEIPQENNMEEKEMTVQEKRELTIEEEIALKKSYIKMLRKIGDDAETIEQIAKLESEARSLQAQLPVKQNAETQETKTNENRDVININKEPGKLMTTNELSNSIINGSKYPLLAGQFDIFEGKSKHRKLFGYDDAEANFYDENAKPPEENNSKLVEIDFEQIRLLTSLGVSEQTFIDSGLDFTSYVNDLLAVRNLRTIQSQAFGKGDKDGNTLLGDPVNLHFQSILDYNTQKADKLINGKKITELTGVTVENINAIYDEYDDENVEEAVLVVDSRSVLSGLKDDAGNSLLKRENRANGSIGTVYGRHVIVQSMNDKGKIVLMNPKAYGVSVNAESKTFPVSGDTTQALRAGRLFISQVYAMGKVVNPYAIKIIK